MSQAKPCKADMNVLVRDLRLLCGLTQEQFAAKLGMTLVTVNRWENNRAKPMPLALRQLRTLPIEISRSEVESDQQSACRLLARHFPKDD
jgi:putative transcriptional regulator